MTMYTYVPFPEDDLRDSAITPGMPNVIFSNLSIWDNGRFIGKSRGHFIRRGAGLFGPKHERPLARVGVADTLLISAHGCGDNNGRTPINSTMIAASIRDPNTGETKEAGILVHWLAQRIQKDGLRTDFRDLRLAVCYSGLAHSSTFSSKAAPVDPRAAVGADCLASLLAVELGRLGYRSIVVRGAAGEVMKTDVAVGYAGGSVPIKLDSLVGSRRFDHTGRRVTVTGP